MLLTELPSPCRFNHISHHQGHHVSASWFTHIPATLHHSKQAPPSSATHSNSSYILQESPPHLCLFRKVFTLQPDTTSNLILLIPFSPSQSN